MKRADVSVIKVMMCICSIFFYQIKPGKFIPAFANPVKASKTVLINRYPSSNQIR